MPILTFSPEMERTLTSMSSPIMTDSAGFRLTTSIDRSPSVVVRPLGEAGYAQVSAGDGMLGAGPAQQQFAVVAAGPCQQRRRAQLGMSPECGLEVRACAVIPPGDGRRAPEEPVYGAGTAGEAPLGEAVRVGLKRGVQLRGAVGVVESRGCLGQRCDGRQPEHRAWHARHAVAECSL